jgi:transcriptional regulator NrdR family protein
MKCPTCGAWTTIKRNRESAEFGYIRRRECGNEHRFTTQELVIPDETMQDFLKKNMQNLHTLRGKS